MNEYILQLTDVSKKFPGVLALDKVTFGIKRGHVHAIVGENGAGKSTLINIISGVFQKSGGKIFLDEETISFNSPREAGGKGIVTIHQELSLVPGLSVANNLFLGDEITKSKFLLDKKERDLKAAQILRALDIQIDMGAIVNDLSVAQCKMIEIGKALYKESKILIMDEPTASISDHEVEGIFEYIEKLRNKGVTIIYISHKLDEIFRICDDITVLRDGKHIFTKEVKSITKSALISAMINNASPDSEYPVRTGIKKGQTALSVENICYANRVKDISFTVNHGEILGIFGVVGAGKTELAKTIIGEYKKSSGRVSILGTFYDRVTPRFVLNRKMAYIPEDRKREGLIQELNISTNIILPNLSMVTKRGFVRKERVKALSNKFVELLKIKIPSLNSPVKNLSGGNQQKVVISKWLASDAQIYIIDEPTIGVDVGAKLEIRKLINKLADEGRAVILISSDLNEVCRMSDRIIVMKNGKLNAQFEKEAISNEEIYKYAT